MRFQYISDLHLEYYHGNMKKIRKMFITPLINHKKKVQANFLLLAGDIGRPHNHCFKAFLEELAPHYDRVFIITGNHEYFKMPCESLAYLDEQCRKVCATVGSNVTFLQNERYDITNELSIFGGTFWTHIPTHIRPFMNSFRHDYKYIPNFSAADSSALHAVAVSKLEQEIALDPCRKWIVMSHHMPSFDLIDSKYKNEQYHDMNCAYASDIEVTKDSRIFAWVYGHTHTPKQSGKFYCNPIGYHGERHDDWHQWCTQTFTYPDHVFYVHTITSP